MKKYIKVISVLITLLLTSVSVIAMDFETFKANVTSDIRQQKELPNLLSIWDNMITNDHVELGADAQSTKDSITKIQAILEYHLSKLPADDSEAYFITPFPPTPLRLIGTANPFCSDGKTLCPSFFRTSTMRGYISSGHPTELIYSNIGDDIPGIKFYNNFLANHKNITAKLINQVPDSLVGATYYFKLDDGKYIFSLKGNQENTQTQNHWEIWFGDQDTEHNLARTKEVFEFVKPIGN